MKMTEGKKKAEIENKMGEEGRGTFVFRQQEYSKISATSAIIT